LIAISPSIQATNCWKENDLYGRGRKLTKLTCGTTILSEEGIGSYRSLSKALNWGIKNSRWRPTLRLTAIYVGKAPKRKGKEGLSDVRRSKTPPGEPRESNCQSQDEGVLTRCDENSTRRVSRVMLFKSQSEKEGYGQGRCVLLPRAGSSVCPWAKELTGERSPMHQEGFAKRKNYTCPSECNKGNVRILCEREGVEGLARGKRGLAR